MSRNLTNLRNWMLSSVRRHGVSGTLRRAMVASGRMARQMSYLHERHVWFRLDLEHGWTRRELPPGFQAARRGVEELSLLKALETVGYVEGLLRLQGGSDLWLTCKEGDPAFACWILRRRIPLVAAPGGWLNLPEGIVCLEDSVTAPAYRGRSLPPASYSLILDSLSREGAKAVITKIEETNLAACRTVEKAGFRPVATMTLVRIGGMRHVTMELKEGEDASPFLPLLPASEPSLIQWIFGALTPRPIY